MAARFLYLKNDGFPTHWDASRYDDYLKAAAARFPEPLKSLADIRRLELPTGSEVSIWHSTLTHAEFAGESIKIVLMSNDYSRRFEFNYAGVQKVQASGLSYQAKPWMVIQELVLMRNGVLRHAFFDMRGGYTVVYASEIDFNEVKVQ